MFTKYRSLSDLRNAMRIRPVWYNDVWTFAYNYDRKQEWRITL